MYIRRSTRVIKVKIKTKSGAKNQDAKKSKEKNKKKKLDDKLELGQRWVEMLTMSRYGV